MKHNLFYKLLDIIFILSVPFLALLLCGNYDLKYIKILLVLSFFSGIFIKFKVLKKDIYKGINFLYFLISLLFSLYGIGLLMNYSGTSITFVLNFFKNYLGITLHDDIIRKMIGFFSIFSTIFLVYFMMKNIVPIIKKEYRSFTIAEKRFLVITSIFGFILTLIIYYKASAFYYPVHNGMFIHYDVIYTTDSGTLNKTNTYLQIGAVENDLRQPLFGLFSLPFSITANFISNFLLFIPNAYYVIFNTIQIALLAVSFILVEKMLGLKEEGKNIFFFFSMCSFGVMLFSFVSEQYIVGLFYLILTIYLGYSNKTKVNYCYVGAVGTLLTSGIIFPFISKFKDFKYWITNIFKCFTCFVVTAIISGQILQLFNITDSFEKLMKFSGEKLLFVEKLKQFIYFVKSIFIAPTGKIILEENIPRYQLIEVDFISVVGCIILLLCLISFVINRKNKFAIISFLWIIFSFIILCIVGWGTAENGLILYSLYFSWAYISLIYLLFTNILRNNKTRNIAFLIVCVTMLYFNLSEFYRIIGFSIVNY